MFNPENVFILVGSSGDLENFSPEQVRYYIVVAKDAVTAADLTVAKYPDFKVATVSSLASLYELRDTLEAVANKSVEAHIIDPDLEVVF